ncbi:MAG: flavodoxin [Lachnospiraceae bacterium]|nr:flavodoxin [Lachnospiraceae bacterium]MDD3616708.1 flavodoxin [Lachnospiraceae bacterium]
MIKEKKLVLYFSVYGTSKIIAEMIAKKTGADLVEIKPVKPYDSNREHYDALAAYAKQEHDKNLRPEILNEIDIDKYETIFIGYPMWWYTMPMIMYTFFDSYDLFGKTIVPFNAHMGSGDGGTYKTIRELEPNATILEGLPLEMSDIENHKIESHISEWLKKIS